ncbi:MAG TPA: hypothetical protein VIK94_03630 [Bacilli bacterium]
MISFLVIIDQYINYYIGDTMKCIKKKRRDLFSLFKYYDCLNCLYLKKDETIVIGRRAIYIYSISGCGAEKVSDEFICFNRKLQKLLYEFSLHQSNNLFLWIDGFIKLEDYEDIFSSFHNLGYNIHIINT